MFPNKTGVEQNTLVQSFFVSEIDQTLEILGSDYSIVYEGVTYTSGSIEIISETVVSIEVTSPVDANTPVHFVYILNGVLETFTVVSAPSQESVHVQRFNDIDPYNITQNNDGTTFLPDATNNSIFVYDEIPSTSQRTIDDSNFIERPVVDGDDIFIISHHDNKIYRMRPNGDTVSVINTGGKPYKAIVVDNGSKEIWVSLSDLNRIDILDYYSQTLKDFITTPIRPTGISVSSDSSVIAVACEIAKQVFILRWKGTSYDQSAVDTLKNPINVAIDDELNVWGISVNSQNLFKILPDNSITYFQTGQEPRDIKFISGGEVPAELFSISFDGNGDYLDIAHDISLTPSGDFTIEFWAYPTESSNTVEWCSKGAGLQIYVAGGKWGVALSNSNNTNYFFSSNLQPVEINTWSHVCISRSEGKYYKFFINGVVVGQATTTLLPNTGTDPLRIGAYSKGTPLLNATGYISNFRFINGSGIYTSNFSVPTEPLTAIDGTVLLTANDSTINDDSASNHTITVVGDTSVSSEVPFGNRSLYFDGNGDYIEAPLSSDLQLGTDDFTIEFWKYFVAKGSSGAAFITNFTTWGAGAIGFFASHISASASKYQIAYNGTFPALQSTIDIKYNQWVHIAIVRSNSVMTLYINGVADGSFSAPAELNGSGAWTFGTAGGEKSNFYLNGYMSNLRIIKGTALYTSDFSVPTEPLTATAETVLLTANDSTINDDSASNHTITVSGDAKISGETPFAPEINPFSNDPMLGSFAFVSPAYVETTSDNYVFGANDFSIDFWFKPTALPGGIYWHTLLDMRGAGEGVVLGIAPGGIIEGYQLTVNEWVHFCYSRINGSYKFFINGSEIASGANAINYTSPRLRIAGVYNSPNTPWQYYGYISNFRMSNGSAIFTSDFTPRTTKSSVTNNTVLLTATGNGFTDESQYSHTLTPLFGAFESTDVPQLLRSFSFDGNDAINCNMVPIGTSDFTVEYWIKYNTLYNYITPISTTPRGTNSFEIGTWADGTLTYYVAGDKIRTGAGAVQAGVWHHIALSRSNSTVKLFVDGIEVGSTPSTENFANNGLGIGYARAINSQYVNGNMCNVRIIVGNGIYTENFTPPTEPLIDISGTVILTAQDAYFKDNSSVNTPLQIIGDPQASGDIPFDLFVGGGVSDRNITITSSFEDKIYTHEMDGSIRHAVSVEGFYPFKIS